MESILTEFQHLLRAVPPVARAPSAVRFAEPSIAWGKKAPFACGSLLRARWSLSCPFCRAKQSLGQKGTVRLRLTPPRPLVAELSVLSSQAELGAKRQRKHLAKCRALWPTYVNRELEALARFADAKRRQVSCKELPNLGFGECYCVLPSFTLFYNAGNIDGIDIDGVSKKAPCKVSAHVADICE